MRLHVKFTHMLGNSKRVWFTTKKNFGETVSRLICIHIPRGYIDHLNIAFRYLSLPLSLISRHRCETQSCKRRKRENERRRRRRSALRWRTESRDFAIVCSDCASYKERPQYLHFREKLVSQSRKAWSFDGRAKKALTTFSTWLRWICFRELSRYIRHREVKTLPR